MRSGSGGPSGVCDKYSGAQREYCESLEKQCLEKGSEEGSGEGGNSRFELVDCNGNGYPTNDKLCPSMAGHLAEEWSSCSAAGKGGVTQTAGNKPSGDSVAEVRPEKKKWAPKSAPRRKSKKSQGILLVNKSTEPSSYRDGALVVANIRIPEHRDAILAFWKKHPSEGMALLNVGYTDEKSRLAAVADVASVLKISQDKARAIVESKLCFTLRWKDGAVVPTVIASAKKPSPSKKPRWARKGAAHEGKRLSTKGVVTLGEKPKAAQELAAPDEGSQAKKKVVTIDEKPKATQKGAAPEEKPADVQKPQKFAEQRRYKTITWPHGFVESSPETIDGITGEINGADYPVMVVVGQEANNLGEKSCSHCVEFKKELLAAQESGEWAYHRLVFINLNRTWAIDHLKKLDIHSEVMSAGFVPQAFVFEGGHVTSPKGDMSAHMKELRKEVAAAAKAGESIKKPAADTEVIKPVEKKPEVEKEVSEAERKKLEAEEKKRAADEERRAAEEKSRLEAEEKKRAEEEEKQRKLDDERRLKEE
nr:hypothetical protein [bacterium]